MDLYFIDEKHPISSYEEIKNAYLNLPKKKGSWGEYKSAETMANYWFNTNHIEFDNLIKSMFGEFQLNKGFFEYRTKFDEAKSGPREHDLCFPYVNAGVHTLSIGIEAKGNEHYDELISKKVKYGNDKIAKGENTQMIDRIQSMFLSMGEPSESPRSIEDFFNSRYQLFSGLCGTIAEANDKHAKTALFLIIQFETKLANPKSITNNKNDLLHFLKFMRISNRIESGQIIRVAVDFTELEDFTVNYSTKDLDVYIGYLNIKI